MFDIKKELKYIQKIFRYLKLEPIEECGITTFLNDDVVFAKTASNQYLIKITPEDAMYERNYAENKVNRIKALESIDSNGVHAIFPIKFNDKYFIGYKNREYEIYNFRLTRHLTKKEVTPKFLKRIATSQAIIHKLNIKLDLPCDYCKIDIKFEKVLKKLKKHYKDAYDIIYDNIYHLEEIQGHYNKNLKYAVNNLVVGYDYYDLDNIDWIENYMFLIDYRNCNKINPAVSLAESAYYFAYIDGQINYQIYEDYIKYYTKRFGPLTFDYKEALFVALNKKLEFLSVLLETTIKEKEDNSLRIKELVAEIINYDDCINEMYNAYIRAVKKK